MSDASRPSEPRWWQDFVSMLGLLVWIGSLFAIEALFLNLIDDYDGLVRVQPNLKLAACVGILGIINLVTFLTFIMRKLR